jgi:glycosyltransferase involved in cell wall biosynthesis
MVDRRVWQTLGGALMVRILRVVWNMGIGGIETTAMHLLRGMDRDRFHTDFLYVEPKASVYDEEIRGLGSAIFLCPKKNLWSFSRRFFRLLKEHGPYNVVHSHLELFTGVVLMLAHAGGVPVRVGHAHTDHSHRLNRRPGYQVWLNRFLIRQHATAALATSRKAAESYYGLDYASTHAQVILQGRDFRPYAAPVDRAAVRKELGIPSNAFVIGHVGRMDEVKNHRFMVRVAAVVARRLPDMRVLFIGDGPLRAQLEQDAVQAGLRDRVVFAGTRLDVPRLLCGAVDAFLFPSLYEGIGGAVVEALAAGLPCVITATLPEELDLLLPPLLKRVRLTDPPETWAEAILPTGAVAVTRETALETVMRSGYSTEFQIQMLERVYAGLTDRS